MTRAAYEALFFQLANCNRGSLATGPVQGLGLLRLPGQARCPPPCWLLLTSQGTLEEGAGETHPTLLGTELRDEAGNRWPFTEVTLGKFQLPSSNDTSCPTPSQAAARVCAKTLSHQH